MYLATTFIALLSCAFSFPVASPDEANKIECYSSTVLAPEEDCRKVFRALIWAYTRPGLDLSRQWGRTVTPLSPDDVTNIRIPVGFQFEQFGPRAPSAPQNLCEIYIDNDPEQIDTPDQFTITDMALLGIDMLDQCYPPPRSQTGRAFPGLWGSVYATTRKLPEIRAAKLGGERNQTGYEVRYLKPFGSRVDEATNGSLTSAPEAVVEVK